MIDSKFYKYFFYIFLGVSLTNCGETADKEKTTNISDEENSNKNIESDGEIAPCEDTGDKEPCESKNVSETEEEKVQVSEEEKQQEFWFRTKYRTKKYFSGSCKSVNLTTKQLNCEEHWANVEDLPVNKCENELNYEKTFSKTLHCGKIDLIGVCAQTVVNVYGNVTGDYLDTYYYNPIVESTVKSICNGFDNQSNSTFTFFPLVEPVDSTL